MLINNLLKKIGFFLFNISKSQNIVKKSSNSFIHKKAILVGSKIYGEIIINEYARIKNSNLNGNISIGRFTSINGPNTFIYSELNPIIIGNFCSIARNVNIQEYNHRYNRISSYYIGSNIYNQDIKKDIASKGAINIMHDVWIGVGAVILSGVTINTGAIIGANAVVNKDVPPYAIVAGNPAKILKYRFDKNIIEILLASKWWDWPLNKIISKKEIFLSDIYKINFNEFINLLK